MEKVAIFVEGQTELIFVREYLLKTFEYQNLSVSCLKLNVDFSTEKIPHDYGSKDAAQQFFIYNVENDNAVLTRIIDRVPFLAKSEFTKVIGLRDMYSAAYKKKVKGKIIDLAVTQKFIDGTNETIAEKITKFKNVYFCYAIMEIEAWFLNMYSVFEHINEQLTEAFISKKLNWDIDKDCAETIFFNPANDIECLYSAVGLKYDKSKGDIEAIMENIDKADFEWLYKSNKSASFKQFVDLWIKKTSNSL
jgi:hypothetical protein